MERGVTHVILGALHGGPKTGYEIKQLVDVSTRFFWAASYGQIYPELHRLEQDGMIAGVDERVGGRRRVRYSLTAEGRARLVQWLRAPAETYELRDEALLKLFFADALEHDEALELVRSLRRQRQSILDRLRSIEVGKPSKDRRGFRFTVLAYGIGLHEWVVRWCEQLEQQLEEESRSTRRTST